MASKLRTITYTLAFTWPHTRREYSNFALHIGSPLFTSHVCSRTCTHMHAQLRRYNKGTHNHTNATTHTLTHALTRARQHARAHARTHTHTHAHTHKHTHNKDLYRQTENKSSAHVKCICKHNMRNG